MSSDGSEVSRDLHSADLHPGGLRSSEESPAKTRFEFATAPRVVFGVGTLTEAGPTARAYGRRALVVTGSTATRATPLNDLLLAHGLTVVSFSTAGEPDVDTVRRGADLARSEGCDLVVGMGGGAAIDAGKAIAAMTTNEGDVLEYLEIIGGGRQLQLPAAPFIAVPTTAGTGAEVTRNSVIASPPDRVKVSLRSPLMMPRVAIVDPELTYELPPEITAATGMDALTQLIEPFLCTRANPLTDGLAREGLQRVGGSLLRAFADGHDRSAREDMAIASLFGGMALANAGLGAVHGLAAPLGGMVSIPHGVVCAALLPHVVETNLRALKERAPDAAVLDRFDEAAVLLTARASAVAEDLVDWLRVLSAGLGLRGLGSYGLREEHLPELAAKAARANSMKANPIALSEQELMETVRAAL